MASMTDYTENALINHFFRSDTFAKPTVLAIALFTSATGDDGSGTEVSGAGYARATRNPSDTNWLATSGVDGHTENDLTIQFPTPTGDWGTVTHFAIYDSASGGNMLFHEALTTPLYIPNGSAAPTFAAGALQVTFD
jgi:hypothetical protein